MKQEKDGNSIGKKKLDKMTVPVIQGGMGIGISMGNLAGTVAANGGMGVISTANIGFREPDFWENPREAHRRALVKEIEKAKKISQGRGLLAINAMVVTTNYEEAVKTACEAGIDAIISGAGVPLSLPEYVEAYDVMIAPIVSSAKAARIICSAWEKRFGRDPDFIVVEGSLAGGHLGFSRDELESGTARDLPSIVGDVIGMLKKLGKEIPVFGAGGIADSRDVESLLEIGARGVQIATPFIATEECDASDGFKQILLEAEEKDVVLLQSPVGMPGRGLFTPLIRNVEQGKRIPPQRCIQCISTCNPATTPYCINQALIDGFYGKYETGLFFCGGHVGQVKNMSTVADRIEELAGGWRKK